MDDDECVDLEQAYLKAMNAYIAAADYAKSFAVLEIGPNVEIHIIDAEGMEKAFAAERKAQDQYLKAMNEWVECRGLIRRPSYQ